MSKGFLIFAQNNEKDDYVKQAYLCALSGTYSGNKNFTLVTDNPVPQEYYLVFDRVIVMADDKAKDSDWKIENRYKAFELSPYDETIVLDSDVLVLDKIDWYLFADYDIYFTQNPVTYRGEPVSSGYYRKTFEMNLLPDVYVGMYYFKKCRTAQQFFAILKVVIEEWQEFYSIYCKDHKPQHVSIDVCAAIVCDMLQLHEDRAKDLVNFVHMKLHAQNWDTVGESWQHKVDWYMNNDLKIGNYKQEGVFHYTEKDFCDVMLKRYKECIT